MSADRGARAQAESILQTLRDEPTIVIPDVVDVEDVLEVIDPEKPEPVNLNRVLNNLVDSEIEV